MRGKRSSMPKREDGASTFEEKVTSDETTSAPGRSNDENTQPTERMQPVQATRKDISHEKTQAILRSSVPEDVSSAATTQIVPVRREAEQGIAASRRNERPGRTEGDASSNASYHTNLQPVVEFSKRNVTSRRKEQWEG